MLPEVQTDRNRIDIHKDIASPVVVLQPVEYPAGYPLRVVPAIRQHYCRHCALLPWSIRPSICRVAAPAINAIAATTTARPAADHSAPRRRWPAYPVAVVAAPAARCA